MKTLFKIFYLIMKISSRVCHMSFKTDFEQSCLNIKNLIFARKYLPLVREILYRNSLFKNVFDQNFFYLFTDFQNFLLHILRQTRCSIVPCNFYRAKIFFLSSFKQL